MIHKIIVFLVILLLVVIVAITYIVISKRNYERLLKKEKEMEDINRMMMRVDRGIEEAQRMRRWADPNFGLIIDEEKKIEPTKHIKRHSIR